MPVHNAEIAALFERLADLLEIQGANPFRVRAYRNAARTIAGHPEPLADLVARGADLQELPGISEALVGKIATIVQSSSDLSRSNLPWLGKTARGASHASRADHAAFESLDSERALLRLLNLRQRHRSSIA